MQHRLELEQLTDLTDYSVKQFGEDMRTWPWYYTTEGVDVYTLQRTDLITVTWTDDNEGMMFLLKHAGDWHIC